MRPSTVVSALLTVSALACSRGGSIEVVPGPVYMIVVENSMAHVMDVWYDDGAETTELGRVEPHASREFVIAGPASTSIEIIGRDDGRTHTITRTAELTRGGPLRVVLSP